MMQDSANPANHLRRASRGLMSTLLQLRLAGIANGLAPTTQGPRARTLTTATARIVPFGDQAKELLRASANGKHEWIDVDWNHDDSIQNIIQRVELAVLVPNQHWVRSCHALNDIGIDSRLSYWQAAGSSLRRTILRKISIIPYRRGLVSAFILVPWHVV